MRAISSLRVVATLVIVFCSLSIYAQDWQCIKTDGEYIYGISNSGTKTIRIDSVYNNSGLTYYINPPTIRWTRECQNPFSYSFLGKKIFSDNEGFYHFINSNNDTLHVKSNAGVNENWIFYSNDEDNLRIWATIYSITFEPFSGTTDSVKLIKFTAKDIAGFNAQHPINSRDLKLSKHYGFSKIFNFDECPQSISTNSLVGINPIKKGYTNFGDKEIWDIQPGEEFHVVSESESSAPWSHSYSRTEIIKTLVERWGNYDSTLYLKYLVFQRDRSSGYATNIFDSVYPPYLYTEIIRFNDPGRRKWNSAPGETYLYTDYSTTYATTYNIISSSDSLYQKKEFEEPQIQQITDSCYYWQYVSEAGYKYCIKGAGGPFHSMYSTYGGDYTSTWSTLLQYSKKGDKVWGTLLDYSIVKGWWPFHNRMTFTYGRNVNTGIAEGEYRIKLTEKVDATGKHYDPDVYNVGNTLGCWRNDRIGMFGTKIYTDFKGNYQFISNKGDTLTLQTLTPVNEDWIFFRNESMNLVIKAHCQSVSVETVINTVDSVKHYRFQAYDLSGNSTSHPVNSKDVALSRSHGFISLFDFYSFPDSINNPDYKLTGYTPKYSDIFYTEKQIGVKNIKLGEVYNMQIGDRVDIVNTKRTTTEEIRTLKTRYLIEKNGFLLKWKELRKVVTTSLTTGDSTIVYLQDTIEVEPGISESNFNKNPGQLVMMMGERKAIGTMYSPDSTSFNGLTVKYFTSTNYNLQNPGDSCYQVSTGCEYYFVENLGGPYEKCTSEDYSSSDELVYYKKGEQTWGNPLMLNHPLGNIPEIPIESIISVYPNPVDETITFDLMSLPQQNLSIQIYGSDGTHLMDIPVTNQLELVNTKQLKPGIYFYRVNSDFIKGVGKFIKK